MGLHDGGGAVSQSVVLGGCDVGNHSERGRVVVKLRVVGNVSCLVRLDVSCRFSSQAWMCWVRTSSGRVGRYLFVLGPFCRSGGPSKWARAAVTMKEGERKKGARHCDHAIRRPILNYALCPHCMSKTRYDGFVQWREALLREI